MKFLIGQHGKTLTAYRVPIEAIQCSTRLYNAGTEASLEKRGV